LVELVDVGDIALHCQQTEFLGLGWWCGVVGDRDAVPGACEGCCGREADAPGAAGDQRYS